MKHLMNCGIALLVVGVLGLMSSSAQAQSKAGQIAFGIDGGGTKYYGNYTDNQFGLGGDAFIRWNIFDWLSLHAAYNGGMLNYKATATSIANENNLFGANSLGSAGVLGTINHTRVGGWDLMASYNVFADQTFVPYFIAGLEALNFEPNDAGDNNLKGNATGAYSKNVIGGVGGVGFEMYISKNITFNGKGLLHVTGTDWMDDYSNPNNFRQDAYITMGLGFAYYIFTPEAPPPPPPAIVERTMITHDIVYHTDTVFVQSPMDSVYCLNPKVNTIFNFPNTFFIVNTAQFNSAVPNNMGNLYQIKQLVNQCPDLKVEIQGFASTEGTVDHNQELSERRAERVKSWLIEEGVGPDKIVGTVGYGETNVAVQEHPEFGAKVLEDERTINRRIAVKVIEPCRESAGVQPSR